MERFKWIAGDALLRLAQLCATAGRELLGKPRTVLVGDHAQGATELTLATRMPLGIVKAIRLDTSSSYEVRRVVSVHGRRVRLDCPTMHAYPDGTEARPQI